MSIRHITFDEFVSVAEPGKNVLSMTLQPNPARSNLTIVISGLQTQNAQLTLTDITGKIIYTDNLPAQGNRMVKYFDLTNYPKGVYVVQLKTNDQVKTERLIIQ
jgi:hypothetical protein